MKTLNINKKAEFNYEFIEEFTAGIQLQGWEVKSIVNGKYNISNSFIKVEDNELFLYNADIQPETTTSTHDKYEPTRKRKLLVTRREINRLIGAVQMNGYTMIPVKLMKQEDGAKKIKLGFALAKGKKMYDKRLDTKIKDMKRQAERAIKKVGY